MKLKTLFKIIYPFIIFLIILFFLYKSTKNGDLINSLKAINIKIIFMVIVIFFIIKIVNTFRYAKLYNLQPSLKLFVLLCYSNMMLSFISLFLLLVGTLPIQTFANFGIFEGGWVYFLVSLGYHYNQIIIILFFYHIYLLIPVI